jgi:hypothetical protein
VICPVRHARRASRPACGFSWRGWRAVIDIARSRCLIVRGCVSKLAYVSDGALGLCKGSFGLPRTRSVDADHDVHGVRPKLSCRLSWCAPERVSRRWCQNSATYRWSVNPVPVSARGTGGNCAKISVSDQRAGLCHHDRLGRQPDHDVHDGALTQGRGQSSCGLG